MKHPHVVLHSFDDWLGNQLRELIAERKWVFREVRQIAGWVAAGGEQRPGVAVLQADFHSERPAALAALAELHSRNPDTDIVVVSDAKLSDEDRPGWMAAALDLGARVVLFPPLTRALLEDAVTGLMDARLKKPARQPAIETRLPLPTPPEEIDLAAGEYEEP
jgi:DNA-binding NarL/FixJ family response regulator